MPKAALAAAALVALLVMLAALVSALGGDDPDEDLVAGPGPETTTAVEVPAAVAADEIPPEIWRGWVTADFDYRFEGDEGGSRHHSRAWWVAGSRMSLAVEWLQESHHVSGLSGCQQGEYVGRQTGLGQSQVSPTPSLRSS